MILQPNARDNGKATILIGRDVIATLWKSKSGVIIKAEKLLSLQEAETLVDIAKEWK